MVSRPGTSLKQFKTPPGHWNWRVPAASVAKNVHQDEFKMIDQKIGWLNTTNSSKASPLRSFHHVEQRACDDRSARRCGESSQCGGAILVGWMMDSITCAHSIIRSQHVSTNGHTNNDYTSEEWVSFFAVWKDFYTWRAVFRCGWNAPINGLTGSLCILWIYNIVTNNYLERILEKTCSSEQVGRSRC